MNATQLITDDMTLEEKLSAIDQAMANAQADAQAKASAEGTAFAPLDPAELTMCEGCQ
ncbi:MAG: hypothetical protein ACTJG2_03895 [Candidatus Saccharimonadales bacterium]